MKRNQIIAIVVGFAILVVVAWFIIATQRSPLDVNRQYNAAETKQEPKKEKTSDNRFASLKGEAYDEAYIADMLAHHTGAVNMAEMVNGATDRTELQNLAMNIMQTQSEEIMQMRSWQKDWGYDDSMGGHGSHSGSANEMSGHMMAMGEELVQLRGEEFEKRFLELMIEHHQQAIDMSDYADTNAHHTEVKDLADKVITAQQREIDQMRQWQKDWGYPVTPITSDGSSAH